MAYPIWSTLKKNKLVKKQALEDGTKFCVKTNLFDKKAGEKFSWILIFCIITLIR